MENCGCEISMRIVVMHVHSLIFARQSVVLISARMSAIPSAVDTSPSFGSTHVDTCMIRIMTEQLIQKKIKHLFLH